MASADERKNEAKAHDLAQLYIEKTYNFDKATPETFFKLYRSLYEKLLAELEFIDSKAEAAK